MTLYQVIVWHALSRCEVTSSELSRLLSEDEAYDYAEFWLITNPEDIVMLVEVAIDICRHCELPIQEKPGWIVHRWIHIYSRAYTCFTNRLTKAAPKENE